MALGASRRKRAKSETIAASKAGPASPVSTSEGELAEMKRMQPRRGEGPYSMARLERVVEQLTDGQTALLARIQALEAELADRATLVAELERRVRDSDDMRTRALERIDRVLDELDELEGRAESAAFPQMEAPDAGRS